jgi:hypothetical protein
VVTAAATGGSGEQGPTGEDMYAALAQMARRRRELLGERAVSILESVHVD